MNEKDFMTPDETFRGLDLYMVNDRLSDEMIRRQIKEFRDKGLYSVIFRTYNGLFSDYPGKEFRSKVRVAIDAARECGLKIVLQAGYMPSAYPGLPAEYALHHIEPKKSSELSGGEEILLERDGIAYLDKLTPAAVNMLDKASTEYYIKTVYEDMWSEFSDEFGKTVISVWVDEPRFNNAYMVWTEGLEEDYLERFGESLKARIDSLYFDVGDYKTIRYRYFTLLRERMEKHYFTSVRKWCHEHDLTFSGHLMGEELLKYQVTQGCALMPFYKYFDIPGIDQLRIFNEWGDKTLGDGVITLQGMLVSTIQCVSAAMQAGKKHILCEMYGVTSPDLSFRDMMRLWDFFALFGINHQCMHAMFYSIGGFRKRFYPQQFNIYQPFWKNFRVMKDYAARVGAFLSEGKPTVETLVLHPLETAYMKIRGLTDRADMSPRADVDAYDVTFDRLVLALYANDIAFHFGDLATIYSDGSVDGNRFVIGKMSYKRVVIPFLELLNGRAYSLLLEFSKNGGEIIVVGNPPERLDGVTYDMSELFGRPEVIRVDDENGLVRIARNFDKGYEFVGDTAAVAIRHNTNGDSRDFMLASSDCRNNQRGKLILPGEFTAEVWNAENGEISFFPARYENGSTTADIDLAPGASLLLRFVPGKALLKPAASKTVMPVEFVCETENENVLTLETCAYKTDAMENFSDEYPVECVTEILKRENYSGNVTLRFGFESARDFAGLKLAIEEPGECVVKLNGAECDMTDRGYYFSESFRLIDLPGVKAGENVIEVSRNTKPQVQERICDDMKHLFELFRAPVGVDLERIHIIGDFSVDTVSLPTRGGMCRISRSLRIADRKPPIGRNVTLEGYPFYIGSLLYESTVNVPRGLFATLRLAGMRGCTSEVIVNGERAGAINRPPYEISVKLREGENRIAVRLFGTLRNAIGPSHMTGIDFAGCSRATWIMRMLPVTSADIPGSAGSGIGWTGNYELAPFGLDGGEILF